MILALLLDLSGTIITLQPTEHPTAIAEVVMENNQVNGPHDEIVAELDLDGLKVWVSFDWDSGLDGEDAIAVSPPDGILCDPSDCVLQVREGETGTLYLYEWSGM